MQPHSLYIHIPFCTHRCAYCDFNTYAGLEHLKSRYVDALIAEIDSLAQSSPRKIPIHTIFFGGGTPSLLNSSSIRNIVVAVKKNFNVRSGAEISMEANPESLSEDYLFEIREAGINRLSLGMQSAVPEELRLLERTHDFIDVSKVFSWARKADFNNINLDLIFALPGQRLEQWQRSLSLALGLKSEHISLYSLSFEHGTPFSKMLGQGLLPITSSDLAADMYLLAEKEMEAHAFHHYEISNWARIGENHSNFTCRHNIQYWRNLPYYGIGAGAHGWVNGKRTRNVLSPEAYIKRSKIVRFYEFPQTSASVDISNIDPQMEMSETMMMGFRLINEGISSAHFRDRFGISLESVYGYQLQKLLDSELIEKNGGENETYLLTSRGRLLGNQVFQEFV